jgi:hypothetical protein
VKRTTARHRISLALSVAALSLGLEPNAQSGAALPERFVLGAPPGAASLAGVSVARDHSSAVRLPRQPRLLWTKSIAGGIACDMLADAAGRVFIAGFGRLTQLSPEGEVEFTRSDPFSRALAAALLNDGTRVVVTEDSQLIGVSELGAPRFVERLNGASLASPSLMPLWDGGVLLGAGTWLLNYDANGHLRASIELNERVRITLRSGRDNLIVGTRGGVYRWDGYSGVVRAGSFGRGVLDAALDHSGAIAARLASDELAMLAPATGALTPLSDAMKLPSGPRRSSDRESWVTSGSGGRLILLRLGAQEPDAGTLRLLANLATDASGQWLTDAEHTLASISTTAALVFQRSDGTSAAMPIRCSEPVSLIPTGAGRAALGCRSGQLWLVGDEAARAPAKSAPATGATEQ